MCENRGINLIVNIFTIKVKNLVISVKPVNNKRALKTALVAVYKMQIRISKIDHTFQNQVSLT